MSIISFKSSKERQGFTPYQSDNELDQREISLFSKLNLNEPSALDNHIRHDQSFQKFSSDIISVGSKKRKLSEELMKTSKLGNKTFLNRSLAGKSSIGNELILGLEQSENHLNLDNELSENSCPAIMNKEENSYIFFDKNQEAVEQKPRFTKTKNLLRNMSTYLHKFFLYNKRAEKWLRKYFLRMHKKMKAKENTVTISTDHFQNKSQKQQNIIQEEQDEKKQKKQQNRNQNQNQKKMSDDKIQIQYSCDQQVLKAAVQQQLIKAEQEQQKIILQKIKEFHSWVSQLSLGNFTDYQKVWTEPHSFRSLYRQLCYKYYKEEAFCDIHRSRLTTKDISVSYLHQFIQGLLHPSDFYRFK